MRKLNIDKPSDATEQALVECRRLTEEAEARVAKVRKRLDAYPTMPDDDALLDVHNRFPRRFRCRCPVKRSGDGCRFVPPGRRFLELRHAPDEAVAEVDLLPSLAR